MLVAALWHCTWGRGQEGAMALAPLWWIWVTPFATHNQIGPLWCWFPSAWACARFRSLWVSSTTSPVRLGVSPAAASTPTGVFNQRFEALFPGAGALGCEVCFGPPHSSQFSIRECGATGSASCPTACPQSTALLGPPAAALSRVLSALAAHLHPSYRSGWMFLLYLLGCRTSGCFLLLNCCCPSFGCARRCSVSTYASILSRSHLSWLFLSGCPSQS